MDFLKVIHDTGDLRYRSPFGAIKRGNEVRLSILIESVIPDRVQLRFWTDQVGEKIIETKSSGDGVWYSDVPLSTPGVYWYYFILYIQGDVYYYSRKKDTDFGIGFLSNQPRHSFQITVYELFRVPRWYRESVMYQIFPDRFHRVLEHKPEHFNEMYDRLTLNDRHYLIYKKDEDVPSYKTDPVTGFLTNDDFYGGNLRGIIEKLDYIKALGIGTVYLNPIFEAYSNHRYNTADYMKIDPLLGDADTFKELCREGEKRGIRFVLDGVFSHTGSDSVYFNKEGFYPETGAYQSKESKWFSWYRFNAFPDDYECWWDVKSLPNVNETDPSYMDFIIRNENSVVRTWIRAGAKGFRLDVADELPEEFIKLLRKALKEEDPEAVLIGEVWEDASNKISYGKLRSYLLGEELDSTMNYPFRNLVLSYLTGKMSGWDFSLATMTLYQNYPKEAFFSCMNHLGTHDVARIRTVLGEAPPEENLDYKTRSKYRLSDQGRELACRRQKAAVILQMTYPGVPMVYYGDEAGLEGYSDPFNRGVYPWGHEDHDMLDVYKKWIQLRNETDALRKGEYIPLTMMKVFLDQKGKKDLFGFIRVIKDHRDVYGETAQNDFVLVLVNRSLDQEHTVGINLSSFFNRNLKMISDEPIPYQLDGNFLTVTLPRLGCAVWMDCNP